MGANCVWINTKICEMIQDEFCYMNWSIMVFISTATVLQGLYFSL